MESARLQSGTKLNDRYMILDVIGEGGFGITYRAVDLLVDAQVAIKAFSLKNGMKTDSCEREIAILKRLTDVPYIARYRDDFSQNGIRYLVMNLIRGETLLAEKNRKKWKTKELLSLFHNLLEALEKMHEHGFIHRDISPGNLMRNEDGDLFLIDFGAAASWNPQSELYAEQVIKHKGFESPEADRIDLQGPWTDIYSLCATFLYLLTGHGVPSAEQRKRYDDVPAILLRQSLGKKQQNALMRGLLLDTGKRCRSARQLLDELYDCQSSTVPDRYEVRYACRTMIGDRSVNQDNFVVDLLDTYVDKDFGNQGVIHCRKDHIYLVAVCDGVGGSHSVHGELASKAATQALIHFLENYRDSEELPERLIERLFDQLNEKVIVLGKKIGRTATTVSVLMWKNDQYYMMNIGDSPVYQLSRRRFVRLSTPHTRANLKQDANLPIERSDFHTLSSYLGRPGILGSQMMCYRHGFIHKGDLFLVCSDGITDKMEAHLLKRAFCLFRTNALGHIFHKISQKKNKDNCTAIAIQFKNG